MFVRERQDAIAEQVSAAGRVTVAELAARFGVTEDCIRKDLKALAGRGLVRRVYGGAMSAEPRQERDVRKRVAEHADEKRAVAEKARALIADGDVVFLDTSTTNLALARLIAERPAKITVVSNMLDILQVLGACEAVRTVGTGGTVNVQQNAFLGAAVTGFLEPLRFDRAFIGALGVDLKTGETLTFEMDDGLVKATALRNARHAYLVADPHKFGAGGSYAFATLGDFEAVVTCDAPAEAERAIRRAGTGII